MRGQQIKEGHIKDSSQHSTWVGDSAIGVLIVGGLLTLALYNYLLFHSLAEIITVAIMAGLFMLIWNARQFLDSHYFLFIAIASFFVGFVDLLHTLSYQGMGVLASYNPNYQTQLWLTARWLQGSAFLIAPLFFHRKINPVILFSVYIFLITISLFSMYFRYFPDTFITGQGLTSFKIAGEYVAISLFAASLVILARHREEFDGTVFSMLIIFIGLTIISELFFTLYSSYYSGFNIIGHLLRLISFYFLYRAVIVAGLVRPYDLLFRSLVRDEENLLKTKESLEKTAAQRASMLKTINDRLEKELAERQIIEEALAARENKYRQLYETMTDSFTCVDMNGKIVECNDAYCRMLGYGPVEIKHLSYKDITPAKWHKFERKIVQTQVLTRGYSDIYEKEYRRKDGTFFPVELRTILLRDAKGRPTGMYAIVRDITERKNAEDALRESEEQYRALFDGISDIIFIYNLEEKILKANKTALEFFGRNEKEFTDMRISELSTADEQVRAPEHIDRIRRFGHTIFETNHINKDGMVVPIEVNVRLIDYRGTPAVLSIGRDITDRKLADEALQRSEVMLRSVVNTAPVGIALATPERIIKWVNETMAATAGYAPEELEGQWARILYPSDKEFALVDEVVYGKVRCGGMGMMDTRWVHRDGRILEMHVCAAAIEPDNLAAGVVFTATDITERKEIEEEIRKLNIVLEERVAESTAELADLYNNAPCGYHSLDAEGCFVKVNDEELRMFGYERDEVIGKSFSEFLTADCKTTFDKFFPGFKERGHINNLEFNVISKSGSILPVLVSATAIRDISGRFVRSRTTVVDNSEQKKIQSEFEKLNKELDEKAHRLEIINKELESFSYSVSHDLKVPLRGIDGYSKLLLEDYGEKLDEEGQSFLTAIRRETLQMIRLIDDLLEYARFEGSRANGDKISLPRFADELLAGYGEETRSRGVFVDVSLPEITLPVNPEGFAMVLRNLFENALKFTKEQEKPVINIGGKIDDNSYTMWVKDNGCGFDMKHRNKIFEIFHRLHDAVYPGTGLGLALVRKAMERMGGQVWAESESGQGTAFFIKLPLSGGGKAGEQSHSGQGNANSQVSS